MNWADYADHNDRQIIQQGTTHRAFVSTASSLLLTAAEAAIAARMHIDDANSFRQGMRAFKMQARLGYHPHADMIETLHSWVDSLISEVDGLSAGGRIHDFEGWMDDTADRIARSVQNSFSHHLD